eukprot:TRINITY_DN4035_c0_g1_i2.p1 TRINITY_DN4035_c0_g1~~TRINITY_DN4035_c0_g1_i2.p1  ORF type:complete len:194 (-),score=21.88 TRINITY_DN4035_c0_g1_i2:110-691(-)
MEDNSSNLVDERRFRTHVDVEAMSISDFEGLERPVEREDDSHDEQCHRVTKLIIFGAISVILPGVCLYVGISYHYCEDSNADWLIAGGCLGYGNLSLYLLRKILQRYNIDCDKRDCLLGLILLLVSPAILIWWVWGFSRIFSFSIFDDPVMDDPVCKEALFRFPFWLSLLPFIMGFTYIFYALCMCMYVCICS